MGNAMTVATCREFRHHGIWMWNTMAILALRNHLMLCLMTVSTGNILMLGWAGLEKAKSLIMAGAAMLVGNIIRIFNRHRHMGLMTGQAISLKHIISMGLMAGGTVWNLTMGSMT